MAFRPLSTKSWKTSKSVTVSSPTRHRHMRSPIDPDFEPPSLNLSLIFSPTALAGSIARTSALKNVPQDVLDCLTENALNLCECLIDGNSRSLVTSNVQHLADAERASFAGCVGAGITDLLMNAIHYAWRDNAECLSPGPHPDFIYSGGAAGNLGVVVAEAHGSFSRSAINNYIRRKAQEKYRRQVRPNLEMYTPHGKVIHGYSIAFGSNPGTQGVFLHISETEVKKQAVRANSSKQSDEPERFQPVSTSLALAAHRSNFALMKADGVVSWIDWLRGKDVYGYEVPFPGPGPAIQFLEFSHAGRDFLYSKGSQLRYFRLRNRYEFVTMFAMEKQCGKQFLNELSGIIRSRERISLEEMPKYLELPKMEPLGFGIESKEGPAANRETDKLFAMYGDGLAVFGGQFNRERGKILVWHPTKGVLR